MVLDNDNHLYHVVVKGLHVRDGKEVSTQVSESENVCQVKVLFIYFLYYWQHFFLGSTNLDLG